MDDPGRVASFGSVNVDRMAYVDRETVAALADRYDWFPGPGETVSVPPGTVPAAVEEYVTDRYLGGKGANQAVAAAAAGADATFLGAVGEDDAAGFGGRDRLRDRGVDVSGVATVGGPTGTAYVFVTPDGENHIATVAGANGRVDAAYARRRRARILAADVLLLQNEVPVDAAEAALDVVAAARGIRPDPDGGGHVGDPDTDGDDREDGDGDSNGADAADGAGDDAGADGGDAGADGDGDAGAGVAGAGDGDGPVVILDPAPPKGAGRLLAHPAVDYATPNDPEHRAVADELAAFRGTTIRTRGPDTVVVEGPAPGGEGTDSWRGGGADADARAGRREVRFEVTPPSVEAVDTTGAGDVFNGYLAARLAAGDDLRSAVETGAVAAALSTTAEGVQRATPDADAVARFRGR